MSKLTIDDLSLWEAEQPIALYASDDLSWRRRLCTGRGRFGHLRESGNGKIAGLDRRGTDRPEWARPVSRPASGRNADHRGRVCRARAIGWLKPDTGRRSDMKTRRSLGWRENFPLAGSDATAQGLQAHRNHLDRSVLLYSGGKCPSGLDHYRCTRLRKAVTVAQPGKTVNTF